MFSASYNRLLVLTVVLLSAAAMQAQVNEIDLQHQVKNILPPTNGGTGQSTSSASGCPSLSSGTWSFLLSNCVTQINGMTFPGGTPTIPSLAPSGSSHSGGLAPDPGSTAGTTRYLREDATWAVPVGGGGGTVTIPGALADYDFTQGTGTVLTDISGNGNNGTLASGGAAPTWTSQGLSFNVGQTVALPSAVSSANTIFFSVYTVPFTSAGGGSYPILMGSSVGNSGVNLLYEQIGTASPAGGGGVGLNAPVQAPSIYTGNGTATGVNDAMSGYHVLAYVLGSGSGSTDHIYIDGVESTSYSAQGNSAQWEGGNYILGGGMGAFAGSGVTGTFYRAVFMPSNTLTAAQIGEISGQLRAETANRGVPVIPQPVSLATPALYCIGDSITAGYPSLNPYCSLLSLTNQPAYNIVNYGIPSIEIQTISSSEPNRVATQCRSSNGPMLAVVNAGTNDIVSNSLTSLAQVYQSLVSEVQTLKTAGCKVFVGTMISRGGNAGAGVGTGVTADAAKDSYDALILNGIRTSGADGVVDFAANPNLGADGANANGYFQPGNIHPTQVGYQLMANAMSNSLNYYFGSTLGNPTVYSTSTTLLSSDRAVSIGTLTGNIALVMPDCTGPSGESYTITNPQAAHTVTIAGGTSQPINGLTSAITITSNSTVTLRDVANPKTVSGCHWAM